MLVFRELRRPVNTERLLHDLLTHLDQIRYAGKNVKIRGLLESALLQAGQLECGLHDLPFDVVSASPFFAESVTLSSRLTDLLAPALLVPEHSGPLSAQAQQLCQKIRCPETFDLSPPEGFCFYALHPLDYAERALQLRFLFNARSVAVVGIRTIGTTLSAVVAAALQNVNTGNRKVERITVRPTGHPYDRVTALKEEELAFVRAKCQRNSIFLIVDEGPGLSGSSFLSVATALEEAGADRASIKFLCGREVVPESLVALHAATRWNRYQAFSVAATNNLPATASTSDLLPDADWRMRIFSHSAYDSSPYRDPESWPAEWTGMTPRKFFSTDLQSGAKTAAAKTIFKYEGLGQFGANVRSRAYAVANAGFGPMPIVRDNENGFTAYPMLTGTLLSPADITENLLECMAHYLAFRAAEFRAEFADQATLEQMTRFNFAQIAGHELHAPFPLELNHPVIADARMMPHEWIRLGDGRILKLDAAAHGDNHFFPGPTDVAWDLAGVIAEWHFDASATDDFLSRYEKISGDDVRSRLPSYLIAYTAFQAGYAAMAASAMAQNEAAERRRLLRDYERYRRLLLELAASGSHACAV